MQTAPVCWIGSARFKTEAKALLSLPGEEPLSKARNKGSQTPGALGIRAQLQNAHAQQLAENEGTQDTQERTHEQASDLREGGVHRLG